MRFSVKRGRRELSKELSRLAPQLDTQNYMSLTRVAGHDKKADAPSSCCRSSKVQVTKWTSLCTMSCWMLASGRRLRRARELTTTTHEMFGRFNVVPYNTVLKDLTLAGEIPAA